MGGWLGVVYACKWHCVGVNTVLCTCVLVYVRACCHTLDEGILPICVCQTKCNGSDSRMWANFRSMTLVLAHE